MGIVDFGGLGEFVTLLCCLLCLVCLFGCFVGLIDVDCLICYCGGCLMCGVV